MVISFYHKDDFILTISTLVLLQFISKWWVYHLICYSLTQRCPPKEPNSSNSWLLFRFICSSFSHGIKISPCDHQSVANGMPLLSLCHHRKIFCSWAIFLGEASCHFYREAHVLQEKLKFSNSSHQERLPSIFKWRTHLECESSAWVSHMPGEQHDHKQLHKELLGDIFLCTVNICCCHWLINKASLVYGKAA